MRTGTFPYRVSASSLTECAFVIARRLPTVLLACLVLAGCASGANSQSVEPVLITAADLPISGGSALTSDERIVAVANGSAEIVYALGLGAALVGRDIASTFPGAEQVPVVTSAHSLSAEQVLATRPTLVLIDARSGPQEALRQIRKAGVRMVQIPEAWTLAEMAPRIRAIGAALQTSAAAKSLIEAERSAGAGLSSRATGVRVAFLYLRGSASVYLLGGEGSGADALVGALGATDVGAAAGLPAFTPLTSEALITAKPDVLLVMRKGLESVGGIDGLVALPGVAQTPAGEGRRVIAVDDEVLLAFGPRTGALLNALADAIDKVRR